MSENQPPQYQQAPPPGYYQPGPPPKKKHTVRNVLLILIALFILFVGGCMALIGGAANEIDKAIKEGDANNKPVAVDEGKAFSHDGYDVAGGWKVVKDFGGSPNIKGLNVTNTQDETRTAQLTFRFYKGSSNLAEVECTGNQVAKGESAPMDCFSTSSKFPTGYDTIKISDMW